MSKKILAAEYIADFLEKKGVTHVFELTGGMVSHLLDAIHLKTNIKLVSVHHEQAAGFAADAYARQKGIPGIAIGTSGPGAINLLTGLGNCYYDSVPAIFITGQVNTYERKGNKQIRQLGFQENEIVPMAAPVCKKAIEVVNLEDIPQIFEDAYKTALDGRPGPVLIDLPMDFQRSFLIIDEKTDTPTYYNFDDTDNSLLKSTFDHIRNAKRPIILAGRGIKAANALGKFQFMVENTKIPVVTSLNGLDVLPYNHPQRIGFIGVYGNRWANIALYESDLIIVLGSRLDIRQTGADVKAFQENKKIIHVDIDPNEINNRLTDCLGIHSNLSSFLDNLSSLLSNYKPNGYEEWYNCIFNNRIKFQDVSELKNINGINPNILLHLVSKYSKEAIAYIADVGNHQMWCAQSLELEKHQSFLTSGGMGAMGYALPAAMGVCFAENFKPVVCIAGDGGFQINIQELQTIVHHNLPIKIIVLNNQSLGMIRQFQDSYFEQRHVSSEMGYSAPDFEKIAKAYDIDACTISTIEESDNALTKMWANPNKPFLLQVLISPNTKAYPKIEFGNPIHIMEP